MNKNDKKILELKKKLEERKNNLGEKPTNNFRTNCMLTLFGMNYNLHTMNNVELKLMFSWLNSINNPDLKLNNFTIKDYLTDIMNRILILDYNYNLSEIAYLESKLDQLISDETKTSIEIEKLAELIG